MKQTPKVKIVLKRCYKGLGRTNDVVSVRAGYARNYLMPKDIGYIINKNTIKLLNDHKTALSQMQHEQDIAYKKVSEAINNQSITLIGKTDKSGNLYRKLTKVDIVKAVKKQLGEEILDYWLDDCKITRINQDDKPISVKGHIISYSFTLLVSIKPET